MNLKDIIIYRTKGMYFDLIKELDLKTETRFTTKYFKENDTLTLFLPTFVWKVHYGDSYHRCVISFNGHDNGTFLSIGIVKNVSSIKKKRRREKKASKNTFHPQKGH
jgi:hypothetical protein